MSKPTDLVQGTVDLLILKILALEPLHGWAIAQRIRQMSGDVLQVGQSALYPALHKLERHGWIKAQWKTSETNRRARVLHPDSEWPESRGPRGRQLGAAVGSHFRYRARGLRLVGRGGSRWFAGWLESAFCSVRSSAPRARSAT